MSNAEYLSRPFPLLMKFAATLRNIAPVRKAFARLAILLRSSKKSNEPPVSAFVGDIPDLTGEMPEIADETAAVAEEVPEVAAEVPADVDEPADVAETSDFPVIAPVASAEVAPAPAYNPPTREQLIRRRWAETGIKMWAGLGALNIQGSAELLPLMPGGARREYDRLEFRLIAGEIVCEGVVVDPPKDRK